MKLEKNFPTSEPRLPDTKKDLSPREINDFLRDISMISQDFNDAKKNTDEEDFFPEPTGAQTAEVSKDIRGRKSTEAEERVGNYYKNKRKFLKDKERVFFKKKAADVLEDVIKKNKNLAEKLFQFADGTGKLNKQQGQKLGGVDFLFSFKSVPVGISLETFSFNESQEDIQESYIEKVEQEVKQVLEGKTQENIKFNLRFPQEILNFLSSIEDTTEESLTDQEKEKVSIIRNFWVKDMENQVGIYLLAIFEEYLSSLGTEEDKKAIDYYYQVKRENFVKLLIINDGSFKSGLEEFKSYLKINFPEAREDNILSQKAFVIAERLAEFSQKKEPSEKKASLEITKEIEELLTRLAA